VVTPTAILVSGDLTPPAVPTAATTTPLLQSLRVTWTPPTDPDLAYIEVYEATAATPAPHAATPATARLYGTEYLRQGLTPDVTRWYWVRAVDASANASAWVAAGSAAPLAPSAPSIELVSPATNTQIPTTGATSLSLELIDNQSSFVEIVVASFMESGGANYLEHLRRTIPTPGTYTLAETITLPPPQGNRRLVVTARNAEGLAEQDERIVYRHAPTAAVTASVEFNGLNRENYAANLPLWAAGAKIEMYIRAPDAISSNQYLVPHTIQIAPTTTWEWTTWQPHFAAGYMQKNWLLPDTGEGFALRLRRDWDGATGPVVQIHSGLWPYLT